MQSSRFSLLARLARKPIAFVFVLLFAGVGASLIAFSRAATIATIDLSPVSSEVSVGSTVAVTVSEDSSTTTVNAVQAELSYDPAKLEFVSISAAGSAFNIEAEHSASNGRVKVARAIIGSLTGRQQVAVVTFRALSTGSATVNVAAESQLLESTGNTNILTGTTGATYMLADKTAPTAPGTAAVTGSTATSITLGWTAATDNVAVARYDIYRNNSKVGSSASLTYTDTGLSPTNTYSYTIAAVDGAGNESARSAGAALATRPDTTAPTAPAGVTSSAQTPTSVTLNWSAASDDVAVTGYRVYRNGTQIGTATSPTYTNSGLAPDTNYSFTVLAYDGAGNASDQTATYNVKTAPDTSAPTTPTSLTGLPVGVTGANLSWAAATDNVGVAGYRVYRNGTQIGTSTGTTYADAGLSMGNTYNYTVAAYDGAGNLSAQTTAVTVALTLKPGDNNADNKVDLTDLSILLAHFNQSNATRNKGDQNGDGVINLYDLSVLLSNWNK